MKKCFFVLIPLFAFASSAINAQGKNFASVDTYVRQLGPLNNLNVATIADTLTRKFPEKYDKARAIFYWIANNIEIDPKATKANDNKRSDPVDVVQLRKATPTGFALLVQEMCSMANIRCLTADGYVKNNAKDINNKIDEVNHTWNVVQLGQSPEQWYYIDAAKASGFTDVKMTGFTRLFTSEYFFADRSLFNLDHYPDNEAWQLGGGPKSLKEFYSLPVISNAAYKYGLQKPKPMNGYVKTRLRVPTSFSFTYNDTIPIKNIFLVMGDDKKLLRSEPIDFKDSNGSISFTYKFKIADAYPVRIFADDKELMQYYVEVED
ncbi:MAG: transglutaminase domain-containing protein [Ferruginibacter sp.]